jgi:hypothetical protein
VPKTVGPTLALAVSLAVVSVSPVGAGVRVTLQGIDTSGMPGQEAEGYEVIRNYLRQLGARYLRPQDNLDIVVLEYSRPGFDVPNRSQLRVVTGNTPPRIKLRYRLERSHAVVASGEETLSDAYAMGMAHPDTTVSVDKFKYEKSILDDWFRRNFSTGRTPDR